jgi:flagellin
MANAITLTSGMRKNLFSLQNTEKLLQTTQTRLATGLRVQKAVDDPINYFTALEHRQRADDLSTRKDEMSESIQLVNAANDGVESISALIASAKSLAQSALSESGSTAIDTLKTQYMEVLNQIDLLAEDSGYKGTNLLEASTVQHEVKFDETGASSLTIRGFDASSTGATLNLVTAGDDAWNTGEAPDTDSNQLCDHCSGQRHKRAAFRGRQVIHQPEHHHHSSGFHGQHDQHPGRRCCQLDER